MDSLSDAPTVILDFIEKYGTQVEVCGAKAKVINGKVIKERSCYDDETKTIRMDEAKDDIEYAKTFKHEFGHFVDDVLGRVSLSEDFENAMDADKYWTNNCTVQGNKNFSIMIEDLKKFDVMDNMYISDILSGVFFNDTKIIEVYENNGMSFYGHDNNTYWFAWEAEEKIVQRETFANLFAIYTSGNMNICAFVEKWFPNTTDRFKKEIEKRVYG
ncbi:MAG: hypothetical protein MR308_06540 [Lachnospiraceae bacterium]|nr:hypothetical protein [Lachnospiraceae bacterium]